MSVVLVLLLTIPVLAPLLRSDFFHFSDEVHIANLYQMYKAFVSGQIPPRLAPDMSYGFGYPLYNYYYVLPYYFGIFFYYLFHSFVTSYKFILLVATLLSAIFMYLFLRKFTGRSQSIVGSFVYLYTPYRAVDLYVRGALGEILAFMFFPLVGLLIYNVGNKKGYGYVGLLGIVTTLFILSHNLSPFLIFPWFLIFFLFINQNRKEGAVRIISALVLGVLGASYWLFPAVLESTLLKSQPQFNFFDHYPFIRQLIYSKWGYGASLPGIGDDISFQIGFSNLFIVLIGIFYLIKGGIKKLNPLLLFTILSVFGVVYMMNIRSTPIWNLLSIANYIQFPWRLLLLTTFITSFLVIFIRSKPALIILVLLTIINLRYFKPSEYFSVGDDYFLNRYFANQSINGEKQAVSGEYPAWLEDYAILPKWVEKRADFLPQYRLYSDNITLLNYTRRNFVEYKANLKSDNGGVLHTYIYYFPGWEARLDGKVLNAKVEEPYGTMSFDIPSGNWSFVLHWKETHLRIFFDTLSIVSVIIMCVLMSLPRKGPHLKEKRESI